MKKNILLILFILSSVIIYSQNETCESSDDNLLSDLNSITKCSIDKSETTSNSSTSNKSIAVVVSSRRRVIRKKNVAKGAIKTNSNHQIKSINSKTNITNSLNLDNTNSNKVIGFNFVEEIPLFKKCENSPVLEQKQCFKKELSNHIKRNLKYPESAYNKAVQGRVLVYFMINNDGSIGRIKVTPPYKGDLLGEEAERIIKKLPSFKPAKHNGGNIAVRYALPISFKIPGVKPSNVKKIIKKQNLSDVFTFNQVETIPQFESCANSNNNSLSCYNNELVKHIENNFAYPEEAVDNDIEGTVNVKFIIDQKGNVINIETKGPENGKILETAAKILISKLPKFKPATKNGKPINVTYNFPVNFNLD